MPPVGERATVAAALPGDVHKLVASTGLVQSTVRRWLRVMILAEPKEVHIVKWQRNIGAPTPFYVAGPGEDKPKPKGRTQKQHSRKWRKERRKERIEREEALAATLAQVEQAARTPQTWASALMGL